MDHKRKAYEEKLAAQLEEQKAQLALYKAKAEKAAAEAKIENYEITERLERKYDAAKTKLKELNSSSDDAWEVLRAGADHAWSDVKMAFQKAAPQFD